MPIDGIDIEDDLLGDPDSYIKTRETTRLKILEDREMLGTVRAAYTDATVDVSVGRDILGEHGSLYKKVPVKQFMGDGGTLGIGFPYGQIRLPQPGDLVLMKFTNNRHQPYVDGSLVIWDGINQNIKLKSTVLGYMDTPYDWVNWHPSGTKWKIDALGNFSSSFILGPQIEILGPIITVTIGTTKVTIDPTQVKCKVGTTELTADITGVTAKTPAAELKVGIAAITGTVGTSKLTLGATSSVVEFGLAKVTLDAIQAKIENGAFIIINPSGVNINGHLQVF